jgi:hypothetical protein
VPPPDEYEGTLAPLFRKIVTRMTSRAPGVETIVDGLLTEIDVFVLVVVLP